jgi:hypothetical protein
MKRRILALAAAFALLAISLSTVRPASAGTCEECAAYCANVPQETRACMEDCCGSASPVG